MVLEIEHSLVAICTLPNQNTSIMKRLLFVVCLTFFSTFISSQSFFTIGANFTAQNGSHVPFEKQKLENFKLTPSIGYGYNFKIKGKWSYQPGIYLGDFGSINIPDEPKTILSTYVACLDQFISYRPVTRISVGLSPSIYYVGYAGITGKYRGVSRWDRIGGDVNRLVFSVVPRVSIHLNEKWSMDIFYRNDLTSVGYPVRLPEGYGPFKLYGYGVGMNVKYLLPLKKKK